MPVSSRGTRIKFLSYPESSRKILISRVHCGYSAAWSPENRRTIRLAPLPARTIFTDRRNCRAGGRSRYVPELPEHPRLQGVPAISAIISRLFRCSHHDMFHLLIHIIADILRCFNHFLHMGKAIRTAAEISENREGVRNRRRRTAFFAARAEIMDTQKQKRACFYVFFMIQ